MDDLFIDNIYEIRPKFYINNIPAFSSNNRYIENYKKIALDHLAQYKQTGTNPNIPESLWQELENSTKDLILKYSISDHYNLILDIGVGLGRLLSLLPSSFIKFGIDISPDYLSIAREKDINVCFSLIEDMPYKNNLFDIIVCTDTLEHVIDLNLACNKILYTLKDDGILVIRVPYRENLLKYLLPDYPYEFAHLRNFDEYSLKLLFEKIFNCTVMEYNKVGHFEADELFKYNFSKIILHLCKLILKLSKNFSINTYNKSLKLFYNPVELNMVIKKSKM